MDVQIKRSPKKQLNHLGQHLLNLRAADQDAQTQEYIEKNLFDYFDI